MPPNNRNLSIPEIDTFIQDITALILNSIETTVPTHKKLDSVLKYVNSRIKKLQKNKSALINKLNKLHKLHSPHYQQKIVTTKEIIKLIKVELKKEFSKSIINYWNNVMKQMNHKDPEPSFQKSTNS